MKCWYFVLLLLFSSSIWAINDDASWTDDDITFDVVEQKHDNSLNYFEEHFSGYTFSTYSSGDQVKRFIFETRLRFTEKPFSNTTFLAEYRYQNSRFDTPVVNNVSRRQYNKEFSYDLNEFRELYINQRLTSKLSFQGGKQTIIWGQWSTFSPIDLLLPFDFAVIGPSFNKEQIKQPVESYNLSYSQNEKWNTTLYYFPNFTLDYSSKKSLDYAEENGETVIYPSSSNQQQYAIRSVYVDDHFNAGITLFKGFEVIRDNFGTMDIYEPYDYRLTVNNSYRFPEKSAIVGEFNLKTSDNESVGIEILFQNRKAKYDDLLTSTWSSSNDLIVKDYLDWIQDSNDGNFYATQYMLISSIGYEKVMSRHILQLSVSYIHLLNPSHTQKGYDLYEKTGAMDFDEDWTETYRFLGSLTYLYYLNQDKTHSVGTMLGFLGSGIGGSFFYGATVQESITFGVGIEYIKYLTDMSFGTSDTGESIVNVDELSLRSGIQYLF